MWECQFKILLPTIQNISTPTIPDILKTGQKETDLISGIKSGSLYGFIVCTINTPTDIADQLKDFPPIIKRQKIIDSHLTPYTRNRIKLEKPNLKKFERETVVQCFNAENHLLLTSLAKYYLEKGLIISNVKTFVQYIPEKSLQPFVSHVTKMRIEAEKDNQHTKGNTAKIYGNSGYGKVI